VDIVLFQPYLDQMGGSEQVILQLARKFNPVIYTMKIDSGKTFPEFSEFDIRTIRPSMAGSLAGTALRADADSRMGLWASAGLTMLGMKVKDDYDVLNAHLSPGEWIRNKNDRVCWYCHGPNVAFDLRLGLYEAILRERGPVSSSFFRFGAGIYRSIEMPIIKKIEKICTCSDITKEKIQSSLGRSDAEVIYPGVSPRDFACAGYSKFFLLPSRIVPEKGLEFAIEAFKKFSKGKNWRLKIAGHLFDNKRNTDYLSRLKSISNGKISFETNVSDARMKELYSTCYAALISSLDEDWGIVALEAMASEKPVISINKGGPTISVVDGKTGFLVNSIDEMAGKISFLASNPNECEKMGKAGRRRVEQNYAWKIFLDKMEKIFRQTARI
jgi:glycosyltransferase involved in cell wall biosynthesis